MLNNKFLIISVVLLGYLGVMASPPKYHGLTGQPNPNSVDMGCVLKHCPLKMARAMVSPVFMENAWCQNGCNPYYYNDTTPGKLHYQNCTTKCALTYEDTPGDEMMSCAMDNECVKFGNIPGSCPKPEVAAGSSLYDLQGEWWQQYGKNALWDCYPCQHIHKLSLVNDQEFCGKTAGPDGPVKAPCFSYQYSYDLFLEHGTKYFEQTWQLPNGEKGKPIDIFYTYIGSLHNETWYILKSSEKYVVLVDCSYMSGWTNVGSILWVRPNHVLTDTEMSEIAAVYKAKLNWNFPEDFCKDHHGTKECSEPSNESKIRNGPTPAQKFLNFVQK